MASFVLCRPCLQTSEFCTCEYARIVCSCLTWPLLSSAMGAHVGEFGSPVNASTQVWIEVCWQLLFFLENLKQAVCRNVQKVLFSKFAPRCSLCLSPFAHLFVAYACVLANCLSVRLCGYIWDSLRGPIICDAMAARLSLPVKLFGYLYDSMWKNGVCLCSNVCESACKRVQVSIWYSMSKVAMKYFVPAC